MHSQAFGQQVHTFTFNVPVHNICYSILKAARKKKQNQMRPGRKLGGEQKKPTRPVSGNKDKTIRQLLGSLYADREYLEQLLKEEGKTWREAGNYLAEVLDSSRDINNLRPCYNSVLLADSSVSQPCEERN